MPSTIPPNPFPLPPPWLPFHEPGPRAPLQPPLVYVAPSWEYKLLTRALGSEALPAEEEMNALGGEGWELAAVVPDAGRVHFYFKRLRE